ncbi:MAG: hypothetical protein QM652_13025 [Legionella sp.]|uniref:hypothetical protein n=1 Tax=Legionella sp. TaxID=459 RepID=UPI0039E2596D
MTIEIILREGQLTHPIVVLCKEENLEQVTTLLKLFTSSLDCAQELTSLSFTPNVKIDFTQDNLKFQGRWLADKKEIQVKNNLSLEKMLQTFIFELCNANNPDLISSKLKYSNFFTADEYATYIEMAEHQSSKKAVLLYMNIVSINPEALTMPSTAELQQLKILSGDETYLAYIKNNGHYDNYINNYNKAMHKRNNLFSEQNKNIFGKTPVNMNNTTFYLSHANSNEMTCFLLNFL